MRTCLKFKGRIYHWCLILVVALGFMTFVTVTVIDAGEPKVKKEKQTLQSQKKSPVKVLWVKEYNPKGLAELEKKYDVGIGTFPIIVKVKDGLLLGLPALVQGDVIENYLMKLNKDGNVEWEMPLGDTIVHSIAELPDGYLVYQGSEFIKINRGGGIVKKWFRNFDKKYKKIFVENNKIILMSDNGCKDGFCSIGKLVLLLDDNFTVVEPEHTFLNISVPESDKNNEIPASSGELQRVPEGWLVTTTVNAVLLQFGLFDELGKHKWRFRYSDSGYFFIDQIINSEDGYTAIGVTWPIKKMKRWILKINNTGHYVKHLISADKGYRFNNITSLKDGYIISAIDIDDYSTTPALLIKIDKQGKIMWKIKSPVEDHPWSNTTTMYKSEDGIWLIGIGKKSLIAIAKIQTLEQ